MKREELRKLIKEELKLALTEAAYKKWQVGFIFKYDGKTNQVKKVEQRPKFDIIHTTNGDMYATDVLLKKGIKFPPKPPRKVRYDKGSGLGSKLISRAKYESILRGAMKDMANIDMGDSGFTHDLAQSMIHDEALRTRIEKDYPAYRREREFIRRLQWDLENYS